MPTQNEKTDCNCECGQGMNAEKPKFTKWISGWVNTGLIDKNVGLDQLKYWFGSVWIG